MISTDSLNQHLGNLVKCQNINISGEEINTNGKVSSVLEIEILNPAAVPSTDEGLKALGRKIALQLKLALTDQKEYDNFKVIFTHQTSKAGVSASVSNSFEFNRKEL